MNYSKSILLITGLLLLVAGNVFSHPGHDDVAYLRMWKDSDGRFEIEGSFVMARDGKVQILQQDGSLIWMPLDQLSDTDKAWVRERVEKIKLVNGKTRSPVPESTPTEGVVLDGTSSFSNSLQAVFAAVVLGILALGLSKLTSSRSGMFVGTSVSTVCMVCVLGVAQEVKTKPMIQSHFEPFKDKLSFRSDDKWFYVESKGIPDHQMMVGITAWQQQVPIPQAYVGRNAWQIPLNPKFSEKPISAKFALFRGAIALAANGVPIFNPIKNDGRTDTFLAGELDEFGGHCGRADDYHYHIAPVHLEKIVGKGNPIGYALDGYPLYGFTDSNGKEPNDLDEFNGRMEKTGYRYYSTRKYPYVNGGLRGIVTVKDDQIDPQPRAYSPRPALTPLRGARITGFTRDDAKKTSILKYSLGGKVGSVKYVDGGGSYQFTFTDPSGKVTTESYQIREDGKRPPPKKSNTPPKKKNPGQPKQQDPLKSLDSDGKQLFKEDGPTPKEVSGFTLSSPAFLHHGKIPHEFTGDGTGVSPPLKWSNAPEGTKCFALQLWHKPKDDGDEVKSYWVLTNIPATITSLEKNSKGIGKDGINDKKRTGYIPMNSKGPGVKEYHITLYALSAEPKLNTDKWNRAELLEAIKEITLAETTLSFTHETKRK
ncbi:MAG: YHYH protein [Zavarzinella sp.]